MKVKTFFSLIVVIGVIVVGFYVLQRFENGSGPANHQFATTTSQTADRAIVVTSKTITDTDAHNRYQINATYPMVSGITNILGQQKINAALYQTVQQNIADFKTNEQSNIEQDAGQSTLAISFSTTTQPVNGLISFVFDQNFYSAGAAHPGDQIDAYTFDVSSGKSITLSDIFVGDYLNVLSQYCANALIQSLGSAADGSQIAQGTAPSADNFSVFVPQADGLHIIFNEYQVASYAASSQEVVVPYSVLVGVINPNGPLKAFIQ